MTDCLLAATNPIQAVGDFLTAWLPEGFLFHVTVIASALALLWLAVNWVERWRGFRLARSQTPWALFRELCRAHALPRARRQLLTVIAEEASPNQCCRVFIEPRLLEDYARAHPATADEARQLLRLLFDGSY